MTALGLDLRLPAAERGWAAGLVGPLADLLYAPGPGVACEVEPGVYRSSLVVVPEAGPALRVSSHAVPAFGAEPCRIRLEPLAGAPADTLGSVFDPERAGAVYGRAAGPTAGPRQAPGRPGWRYEGPALRARLGRIRGVRLLREHARGRSGDLAFAWHADRGLVLDGAWELPCLVLAEPHAGDAVALRPAPGLFRGLLEPAEPGRPGASVRELLGYGEWGEALEVSVSLEPVEADPGRPSRAG